MSKSDSGFLIQVNNISVAYGSKTVLENASLTVSPADFIGIIGPNGGGKTTLLKAILGLVPLKNGQINFSEKLKNKGGDIGYLSQINKFDNRFPITVTEVILSGLAKKNSWFQRYSKADKVKVQNIIEELGIGNIAQKPIGELSGGQMQRVFLGRSIISDPKLLVLDEPGTYVDNKFESELYEMLHTLNERMAILLVSHDVGTICTHVKSIACVNQTLHYHPSNIISAQQLQSYNCPIQIITHGEVPHTVLGIHSHKH
jgi:zinc transport system ATP-binding protein